ncbi:hypothetical protein [Methyloversatilis sp.]|uniref:hypothetical protein n=1 Tax=Methyloversatilis sp. TaxID=2569862 RepID=UPI0035AF4CB7
MFIPFYFATTAFFLRGGPLGLFAVVMFTLLCIAGYVGNIISLAQTQDFTGMTIIRILGVFMPMIGIPSGYV